MLGVSGEAVALTGVIVGGAVSIVSLVAAPGLAVRAQRRDRIGIRRADAYLEALGLVRRFLANAEIWLIAPNEEESHEAGDSHQLSRGDAAVAVYGSRRVRELYDEVLRRYGLFVGQMRPAATIDARLRAHYRGDASIHVSEVADIEQQANEYRLNLVTPYEQLVEVAREFE